MTKTSLLLSIFVQVAVINCNRVDVRYSSTGSSIYTFEDIGATWYGARQRCQELKGDLVTEISGQDLEIIDSNDQFSNSFFPWVGIEGTGIEGTGNGKNGYKFLDGKDISIDLWGIGQPNVVGKNKECGYLLGRYWYTIPCDWDVQRILCKVDINNAHDTIIKHLDKNLGKNRTENAAKILGTKCHECDERFVKLEERFDRIDNIVSMMVKNSTFSSEVAAIYEKINAGNLASQHQNEMIRNKFQEMNDRVSSDHSKNVEDRDRFQMQLDELKNMIKDQSKDLNEIKNKLRREFVYNAE